MDIDVFGVIVPLPPLGQIVFMNAAGISILAGAMMVTRKNAVHSALWLVVAFFQLAIMYVMLGAEFLAALQVLVYTGAIVVLFLFVIMLLSLREGPKLGGIHRAQMIAAWPMGLILALELVTVILFSTQPAEARIGDVISGTEYVFSNQFVNEMGGNVQALGQTLYTQYLLPFEIASVILLLAVIGAIVLARKEEPEEVEEMLPSIGISLGRRSFANSPQSEQIDKKLRPALGMQSITEDPEVPTFSQPDSTGAGTTSGVELEETSTKS